MPAAAAGARVPRRCRYALVYEDDWLLVVDKPAGVVVHPAPGHEHGTLAQGLVDHGARGGHELRPGIVHRLDKDTSGLLIVARREDAYRRSSRPWSVATSSASTWRCCTATCPRTTARSTRPSAGTSATASACPCTPPPGAAAVTHFRVLGRAPGYTLVRVQLETGRTHQIRVHFAALGYPVAGDAQYGRRPRPEGLGRQFLHAARLAFPHPEDGRRLEFTSPLPADLQAFASRLGLPPDPRL